MRNAILGVLSVTLVACGPVDSVDASLPDLAPQLDAVVVDSTLPTDQPAIDQLPVDLPVPDLAMPVDGSFGAPCPAPPGPAAPSARPFGLPLLLESYDRDKGMSFVPNVLKFRPGDFDGDGINDFFVVPDSRFMGCGVFLSWTANHGDGGGSFFSRPIVQGAQMPMSNNVNFQLLDLKGIVGSELLECRWCDRNAQPCSLPFPQEGQLNGDFNHDRKVDLFGPASGRVWLNNGNKTFQEVAGAPKAAAAAVADFDQDASSDVIWIDATAMPPEVHLSPSKGDGSFVAGIRIPLMDVAAACIATADFNNDGRADFAAGKDVRLGDGKGGFGAVIAAKINVGCAPALGDIDGDGRVDAFDGASVFLGKGDGTFGGAAAQPPLKQFGFAMSYDAKGTLQLVDSTSPAPFKVAQWVQRAGFATAGGALPSVPWRYLVYGQFSYPELLIADLDGDGASDVVLPGQGVLSAWLGGRDRKFRLLYNNVPAPAMGSTNAVAVDLNGDRRADLAVVDPNGQLHVYLNDGACGFTEQVTAQIAGWLRTGDVDGDGKVDLIIHGARLRVLRGRGDGSFVAGVDSAAPASARLPEVGDLNGDGKTDLAFTDGALLSKGDGTFNAGPAYPAIGFGRLADMNADGWADWITTTGGGPNPGWIGGLQLALGKGDGTFAAPVTWTIGSRVGMADTADVDGDGVRDVVVANRDTVSLLLFDKKGTPQVRNYASPFSPLIGMSAAADFDGDGTPDVLGWGDLVPGAVLYGMRP